MHKHLLDGSPLILLPIVALAIFATVFVAILIRTMKWPKKDIERESSLVFEEGEGHG